MIKEVGDIALRIASLTPSRPQIECKLGAHTLLLLRLFLIEHQYKNAECVALVGTVSVVTIG